MRDAYRVTALVSRYPVTLYALLISSHPRRQIDKLEVEIELLGQMYTQRLNTDCLRRIVTTVNHVDARVESVVILCVAGLAGQERIAAKRGRLFNIGGPKTADNAHFMDNARTVR